MQSGGSDSSYSESVLNRKEGMIINEVRTDYAERKE
jgi:hypothetical protein